MDPERRAGLLGAKLRALVADEVGAADVRAGDLRGVATLTDGTTGWVHGDDDDVLRVLGAAIHWTIRRSFKSLVVLVDDPEVAAVAARRVQHFRAPAIAVRRIDGRTTAPAEPSAPPDLEPRVPDDVAAFAAAILDAGADPVVEDGTLVAEVLGLEVARVVTGDGAPPRLEVGVGRHDRDARIELFGSERLDPVIADDLARTVGIVRSHRTPDAPHHPLNRLRRERWLRALLLSDPGVVGLASLRPVTSPTASSDMRVAAPAFAVGEDPDGNPVVVACSVGIDPALVPAAADVRAALDASTGREHRLVLVVPTRDDHAITRTVAEALRRPAEVVATDLLAGGGGATPQVP